MLDCDGGGLRVVLRGTRCDQKRGKGGLFPAGNSVWDSVLEKTRGAQVYGLLRTATMCESVGELTPGTRGEGCPSDSQHSSTSKPSIARFCAVLLKFYKTVGSFLV